MCRVDDKGERCSKVVSRRQNDVSFFSKFFSSTKKRIWKKVEKNSKKKEKKIHPDGFTPKSNRSGRIFYISFCKRA